MSNTIRAFIAIELPSVIKSSIESIQARMKLLDLPFRWVRMENIHLTLKFLGDIQETEIERIESALHAAVETKAPFPLSAKDVGVFPDVRRPRVIWVGVYDVEKRLAGLQNDVDKQLHRTGYAKERRPFKGHLTIGRVKRAVDGRKLNNVLDSFRTFESPPFQVDSVFLFQSILKPEGPEYKKLIRVPLTRTN